MVRNTVQRRLLLETVRSMTNHPSADEVYETVLPRCPGISRATVYRVLGALADEGEIQRVAVPNAPDRFDFTLSCHAHCRCLSCGRVFDFPIAFPEAESTEEFRVEGVEVLVTGKCRECLQKEKNAKIPAV